MSERKFQGQRVFLDLKLYEIGETAKTAVAQVAYECASFRWDRRRRPKNVATPVEAIADGADYLVIGRRVAHAVDPRGEMPRILDEIQAARSTRP